MRPAQTQKSIREKDLTFRSIIYPYNTLRGVRKRTPRSILFYRRQTGGQFFLYTHAVCGGR